LVFEAQGRYEEAEPLYRRALAIDEVAYGPNHANVAADLTNLAVLFRKTNRVNEAVVIEKRAAAIRAIKR
jgi:tetratricopeptide (TPR) repeat protein